MKPFYKTILLLFLNAPFLILNSFSQAPGIEWSKCYGGDLSDGCNSVMQTADGGYIVAGQTHSTNGDVTGNHGTVDYWILKLDSAGTIVWKKCLGGSFGDWANSVQQTFDGGYIVGGHTSSLDGNVIGNHGDTDYWIVKLNSNGNVQWKKCLGGSDPDQEGIVKQTPDSGYIVGGYTWSEDGNVTGIQHGHNDFWLVKLNANGILQWQNCLGGSSSDYATDIALSSDGGYIMVGRTWSNDYDVSGNHDTLGNVSDWWVVKTDSIGNFQWQNCLGGTSYDEALSVQQTFDSGYIIAGYANSYNGNVTGNHGGEDYWIVKLNSTGNLQWQKCLGGTYKENAYSIIQAPDSNYVIAGYTRSFNGDITGTHDTVMGVSTYGDAWIVKIDSIGNIIWEKCYGGTGADYASSIQPTSDGGYIVGGATNSHDWDVIGNNDTTYHGNFWIFKLFSDPITSITQIPNNQITFSISPNPSSGIFQITFPTFSKVSNFGKVSLEVISTLGQTVFSSDLRPPTSDLQTNIDVSFLPKGIYVLKINDGVCLLSKAFIIQ